ncbi:alpha/beta fold hydrolase [Streptomyces sp. NPDC058751]|uniref:alpha/beta fold hydrolase n=1 Tax=Streptomyces sp. NPDC058751 TaxID=3346623 RepID=UPI0036BD5046
MPALYVWGTEDTAFGPGPARETGRRVDGPYRFEVLPGLGHWIPEVAPGTLNRLLLDHLRTHGGRNLRAPLTVEENGGH